MKKVLRIIQYVVAVVVIAAVGAYGYVLYTKFVHENKILREVISRLEAETRVAEVLVTGLNYDENQKKTFTTIKFLEYDFKGEPLEPKHFTFSGNIIQFQALVIRFDDIHIRRGHELKGKSAHIFWKAFMLDGKNTQEFEITKARAIPRGYKIEHEESEFEKKLWAKFWEYALDPTKAKGSGIKNAQIEAPGTMFIPGILYTIKIEHDGGLRIDTSTLSPILRGEIIPK